MIKKTDLITCLEPQAQLFKVLTHPTRLAILELLRDGEHCVCHLEAHLGLRQASISQQLAVLRSAGLIHDRRDGWNIFYQVTDPAIYRLLSEARTLLGGASDPFQPATGVDCPCPHCKKSKQE